MVKVAVGVTDQVKTVKATLVSTADGDVVCLHVDGVVVDKMERGGIDEEQVVDGVVGAVHEAE